MEACHGHSKKRISLEVYFWAQGKFAFLPPLIFLVWESSASCTPDLGEEGNAGLEEGGERGHWVCVTPPLHVWKPVLWWLQDKGVALLQSFLDIWTFSLHNNYSDPFL